MPTVILSAAQDTLGCCLLAADLPSSSGFERWVLEQPWPLALAFVALGIAGQVALRRRSQRKTGFAVMGLGIMLAVGVSLAGLLTRTDRERLIQVTANLIRAVPEGDKEAVDALLAPEVVVASSGRMVSSPFGREEILGVVAGFEWFRVDEWYQRPDGVALDGPNSARTRAVVRVRSSYYDSTLIPMTWEFTWRRVAPSSNDDAGWRLARIELLTMWGRKPMDRWPDLALRAANWATQGRPDEEQTNENSPLKRSRF